MKKNLSRLIKRVQDTQTVEIGCSECLDLVSQYVDIELSSQDAGAVLPGVKQHLEQCLVCSEEYHILHDLAVLEADDRLPEVEDLKERLRDPRKKPNSGSNRMLLNTGE